MKKSSFAQRPLAIMLGLAMLAGTVLPAHAQFVRNTDRTIGKSTFSTQGDDESTAAVTRARLAKALPAFWASTQPGQSYMIFTTMIRRGLDGSVTSNEKSGPYTFSPSTSVADVQTNAPDFVSLLLGQYATQSRMALAELTEALQSYFDSTRPGQGTALNGGQTMRNSDGTATFTDGTIIFVFDEGTSALTVATMAPALALALSNYASAIETGTRAGGYALRDPSNANQLINFDGRTYDTAGNALPNASATTVAALFGNGNGGRGNTTASSGGTVSSGNSSGSTGNAAASTGSNAAGAGSSNANAGSNGSNGSSGSGASGSTGSAAGGASNGTGSTNAASGSGSGSGGSGGYSSGGVVGSNGSTGAAANSGASTGAGASSGPSGGTSNAGTSGSVATGSDAASPGSSAAGGVSGTGLNGNTPLSTSSATGVANSNFGNNGTSSGAASSDGGVCHVFRVLGGNGGTSCN